MVTIEADFLPLLGKKNTLALVRRLEALSVRAWMPERICYDRTWACRLTPMYPSWSLNCITPLDPSDDEDIEERIKKLCLNSVENPDRKKLAIRLTPLASPAIKNFCKKNWEYYSTVIMLIAPFRRVVSFLHEKSKDFKKKGTTCSLSIKLKTVSKEFYVDVSFQTHDRSPYVRTSFIEILQRITGRKIFFLGLKNGIPVANMLVVYENHFAGLLDFAVLKSLHQQKVEYMFFLAVLRKLQEMDIWGIWLKAEVKNRAVFRIYKTFGFIPCYRYTYWIPNLL